MAPTAPAAAPPVAAATPVSCAVGWPRVVEPARGHEAASGDLEAGGMLVELHYVRRSRGGIQYMDWFPISRDEAKRVNLLKEAVLMRRGDWPWRVVVSTAGCPEMPEMH